MFWCRHVKGRVFVALANSTIVVFSRTAGKYCRSRPLTVLQCESKIPPPRVFRTFFRNGWEFLISFLHTYYVFLCTPDYKFLFNYFQL